MGEAKLKCGIDFQRDTIRKGYWSFGILMFHWKPETYLVIRLFKWTITIGKFYR